MSLIFDIAKALVTRPGSVFRTASALAPRLIERGLRRAKDKVNPSFATKEYNRIAGKPLIRYQQAPAPGSLAPYEGHLALLCDLYLGHRFNLLGSGWVKLGYNMECPGLEGHRHQAKSAIRPDRRGGWLGDLINKPNLKESRRIWLMVGDGYAPIDWQLDFKSGFRWSQSDWSPDITYGGVPGADVKTPWELARFQHLPHLALAYQLAASGRKGFQQPSAYYEEFCNQILDFTALNPPRFGVNWSSTIEVALRVCSWLFAYDLFAAAGAPMDEGFKQVFKRSVYEHARHIAANFEWIWDLKGNHYLANVVGLLISAAYLPRTPETDAWLALGIQELTSLVESSFGQDGGNFEASTSYHRFCAEMVVYATAVCLGLPREKAGALRNYDHRLVKGRPRLSPAPLIYAAPAEADEGVAFPDWYKGRLAEMARFTKAITRPDGRIPQIGDNDNARFLKIPPNMQDPPGLNPGEPASGDWDEDFHNHAHLVKAVGALMGGDKKREHLESRIILALSKGRTLAKQEASPPKGKQPQGRGRPPSKALSGFGLYIFRSERIYLCLRCGHVGQNGYGGHAHNDQLAMELCLDGIPFLVDPGTYNYTALPGKRNLFRGVGMHNTIQSGSREPNKWPAGMGLFRTEDRCRARVERFDSKGFAGVHHGFGAPCRRTVQVGPAGVQVEDSLEAGTGFSVHFNLDPEVRVLDSGLGSEVALQSRGASAVIRSPNASFTISQSWYSPGYGIIRPTKMLRLSGNGKALSWEFLAGAGQAGR